MKKFSLVIIIGICSLSYSQSKSEKEERIDADEFPSIAKEYFNPFLGDANHLKYFKETDGEKQSFEMKFKYKKEHFSVEFDTLGNLEDIEIVIKEKHLPSGAWKKINQYFKSNYKKVSLVKVQKQYKNTTYKSDRQFIKQVLLNSLNKHTHFEIIAEIKTKNKHELREFTFDRNGKFEKSREVTSSSYEHALY